jgi:hypothetical protein
MQARAFLYDHHLVSAESDHSDNHMQKKSENVAHPQDRIKLKKRQNPGCLRNSPRTSTFYQAHLRVRFHLLRLLY